MIGWVCFTISFIGMLVFYEHLQKSRDAHIKTLEAFKKYIEESKNDR